MCSRIHLVWVGAHSIPFEVDPKPKATLMLSRRIGLDLAACLLSLVSVWPVLLVQEKCWPEIETQA